MDEAPTRKTAPLTESEQALVEAHLDLVDRVAGLVRRQAPTFELGEIVAFGYEGLIEAAQRFDVHHGGRFADFAYHRVRGAMWDGIRRSGFYSRSQQRHYSEQQQIDDYRQRQQALSETLERMAVALSKSPVARRVRMTDAAAIPTEGPSPETHVHLLQLRDQIRQAAATLETAEREILSKHYFEQKTLAEAGAEMGLSKSWASRLHARALSLMGRLVGKTD
jgi:RNA polymerase sigma factor for flagellar operon FliA